MPSWNKNKTIILNMRIIILIFLALVLSTPVFAGTPGEVVVGGFLREATLDGVDGGTKTFSDFKGKPLLINVWASCVAPVELRWVH